MKKTIPILLVILLLSLVGCSFNNDRNNTEHQENGLNSNGRTELFSSEAIAVPDASVSISRAVRTGNSILLFGNSDNTQRIYRMDISNLSISFLGELPVTYLSTWDGHSDGSACVSYRDGDGNLILSMIGVDGSISSTPLLLPDEMKETMAISLFANSNGYILQNLDGVFLINFDGTVEKKSDSLTLTSNILRNGDDSLIVISTEAEGIRIRALNNDLSFGESYYLSELYESFLPGDEAGIIYGKATDTMFRVDYTSGTRERIANLFTSGVNNAYDFFALPEDRFFTVEKGVPTLWTRAENQNVTVLRLATCSGTNGIYDDYLRQAVSNFNMKNTGYVIDIVDYGVYATATDAHAGMTMLNTDIISGNTPDIYDIKCTGYVNYASRNLLENLKPFFEADESVTYESILPSVRNTLEFHGGLYSLVPTFNVTTMFAPKSLDSSDDWSMDKFLKLTETYNMQQLFGLQMTREDFMRRVITYTGDEFVNYESSECNFVSEQFISLLTLSSQLPETPDFSCLPEFLIYSGDQFFFIETMSNIIDELQYTDAIYQGHAQALGFPSNTRSGVSMSPCLWLGMSSTSKEQAGVWEFFSYLLSEAYQRGGEWIPVIEDSFNIMLDSWLKNYSPKGIGNLSLYDLDVKTSMPNSQVKQTALDIIEKIDCTNQYDETIMSIITSEAAAFYAGDKTATQVAEIIQSKISIYLAEQG